MTKAERRDYMKRYFKRDRLPTNGMKPSDRIAVGLAMLSAITPPGYSWSYKDIADVCSVSISAIQQIEEKAIKHVKTKLEALLA